MKCPICGAPLQDYDWRDGGWCPRCQKNKDSWICEMSELARIFRGEG